MLTRNTPWAVGFGLVAMLVFGGCVDETIGAPAAIPCTGSWAGSARMVA